ncbi:galactofuranose ABC transporter, permease protein YjfF [Caldicellulosiruptor acetigenus]|uniref:galactofuranose ABC transporter, permease protein YjfF n=1 Tax=Caldicellulosiruptor acetigenus TaxID=301953 RepID=UPI00040988BE|nr:galactofuranose ABC transporter, permease protein YjfF [Caldicellulosiruptor acetigenus]WAM36043.1 sugar ABC transporter permease YjfF [Caldicellulosiruptor acetigenus]
MNNIVNKKNITVVITIALFILLYLFGAIRYPGFLSPQVFCNLFIDNAFLIVTAVGITFVILTGGIDISVGAVIALVCMISAYLLENLKFNPIITMIIVLVVGSLIGYVQGVLIQIFKIQPFIVTFAGMLFARGMTAVISTETINITNKFYVSLAGARIKLFSNAFISPTVLIALFIVCISYYIANYTSFGRYLYAIGGNENSAILMGIPVTKVKILVYTLNGLYSAIAGIIFSLYMLSGYPLHAQGVELDAIASSVIGGTLLTGGVGNVVGAMFGVLILGTIQSIISFDGTLNSWWTKIFIGILLTIFIFIQNLLTKNNNRVA